MKRITITFLILFTIIISSCEKDDFCTQNPVTPSLVLKFMDYTDVTELKRPDSLYVWANGKDSLYKNVKVDSVFLPLNTSDTKTVYYLASGKSSTYTITVSYDPKDVFVSRSCGFRTIFNNVSIHENNLTTNWVDSISTKEISTINNQTNAHFIIYH